MKTKKSLNWTTTTQLVTTDYSNDKKFIVSVTVSPLLNNWHAIAIVTVSTVNTLKSVLDEHSHKYLGEGTLNEVLALDEKYITKWKTDYAKCACTESNT